MKSIKILFLLIMLYVIVMSITVLFLTMYENDKKSDYEIGH